MGDKYYINRRIVKMDIAFCLFKYFPYGGLQRDFMQFYQLAVESGYSIRVYCISWDGPRPDNLNLITVPVKGISNQSRNKHYSDYVLSHLKDNPVGLVVGFNKMPGLDVYFAADTCFEAKAQQERSWFYRQMARYKYFAAAEKSVFKRGQATKILLISATEKEKFSQYYQTEQERMTMLPPGISIDRKAPANAEQIRRQFRQQNKIDDDDNVLLFVASAYKTKGLDRAIIALASLPEQGARQVRLLVVGEDKPQRFVDLAEKLKVSDRIKYFGSRDDVLDFYLGADCLVHPARTEAAGIVLLEALVAGLPIVVTDICGYAHHIENASAGLVLASPFEQAELNAALETALDKPQLRQWRSNAISYAERQDLYSKHTIGMAVIEAELAAKQSAQVGGG